MGSKNDMHKLQNTVDILKKFGVPHVVRAMSAHRTPHDVAEFATNAEADGIQIIICAAGLAAHLAGVVAAHTTLPVIGIPVDGGPLNGLDALYATVQMPGGIPVATVAIGSAGATNAAVLAVEILALADPALKAKLKSFRQENAEKVRQDDAALQAELAGK
jgi:5-(carboxyamino)imidazole ribonucleotide mutase